MHGTCLNLKEDDLIEDPHKKRINCEVLIKYTYVKGRNNVLFSPSLHKLGEDIFLLVCCNEKPSNMTGVINQLYVYNTCSIIH